MDRLKTTTTARPRCSRKRQQAVESVAARATSQARSPKLITMSRFFSYNEPCSDTPETRKNTDERIRVSPNIDANLASENFAITPSPTELANLILSIAINSRIAQTNSDQCVSNCRLNLFLKTFYATANRIHRVRASCVASFECRRRHRFKFLYKYRLCGINGFNASQLLNKLI